MFAWTKILPFFVVEWLVKRDTSMQMKVDWFDYIDEDGATQYRREIYNAKYLYNGCFIIMSQDAKIRSGIRDAEKRITNLKSILNE